MRPRIRARAPRRVHAGILLLVGVLTVSCGSPVPAPIVTRAEPQSSCAGEEMLGHRFVTSISSNGRYFEDQHGDPILVFGDSPWAGLTRWTPQQAAQYFANRESNGFNASIISLVGATKNGAPDDDGRTFDGILPFDGGNITQWNEPYWDRVDKIVQTACEKGNTLFLYPIDGWNVDQAFQGATLDDARRYGTMVATRYSRFPNIVWMTGGDYFPPDLPGDRQSPEEHDAMFEQVFLGIRDAGDTRPFSIQLGYQKSMSTDSPSWARYADWNFVYTYLPTYRAVLDAYHEAGERDPRPALLAEANYERENNSPDTPETTDETLRRQMLWALTSGSPGYFYGSDDWEFPSGWEGRLNTLPVTQLGLIRDYFHAMEWWRLVPDESADIIVDGRGVKLLDDVELDVLGNDYLTASRLGGDALIAYVPTARTVAVDVSKLGRSPVAHWVDPAKATAPPVEAHIGAEGLLATPGTNSANAQDWILLLDFAPTG